MKKLYELTGLCLVLMLLVCSIETMAQSVQITGRVTSGDDGTALPGVSILEKSTTNGTVTDAEGNYSITVDQSSVLVFSFVGFQTEEVSVAGRSTVDVVLNADITALNEIVIVGYGEQERKDVTGVVSAVDSKLFNKGAIVSPDQLISGKIAGVQITQNSGEPGAQSTVRIRGGTSINASNEPLYVIDGVPIDNSAHDPGGFSKGRNPLNFINPADIETFTVLKDASAAAIYGSRAANGVIIITTKRGKAGVASVTYDGWASVGQIAKKIDVFNANQFREVIAAKAPQNLSLLGGANTEWQDEIYQTATGQSHSVTFSSGTEKSNYRASVGHQDQKGIITTSSTKRTSVSLSLNQKLFDDNLDIALNFKGSNTRDRFSPDVVGAALEFDPTKPVYDEESPWGGYYEWYKLNDEGQRENIFLATDNPVSSIDQTQEFGETNRSIGNIQFDYKIEALPGLSANLNLGYDISNGDRKRFAPRTLISTAADTGQVRIENLKRTNQLLEGYLKYSREVESISSTFDVTAGYSWQEFYAEYPGFNGRVLTSDIYGFNNPSVAQKVLATNSVQENRLISFFGRLNYAFKDRYLLTATVRRDGSSRFGPANEWGIFPSAAFAWRIIDEPFMSVAQNAFTDLKLRVGYGITGNQEIGNYKFMPTYTPGASTAQYQFGNGFVSTIRPSGVDPELKWEETSSLNIGLDYGIFNGRINGSVEFYQKNTSDLLFEVTVPAGSNLTNIILSNIGELRNRGFELTIDALAVTKSDFSWNVGFNFAINKNEILALDGSDDPGFKGYPITGISGGTGNNIQILRVGQSINSFYVYRHIMNADGNPMVDQVDHNEDGAINLADMYEDVNGDGEVNDQDLRPYKKPAPDALFGLTSSMVYKSFDLNFTLRGSLNNYVYNNIASQGGNFLRAADTFAPRNMTTSVLETNFVTPQYFSDYYVEDASFLRMDNITLGYNARTLSEKIRLRLYGTVQNLFVLTDYSGLDPEVNNGLDNNLYPRSRTFIFGISLGF